MQLNYDKDEFYRAHLARDPRFDGKFFVAVKSTKIYCRPVCPAKKAKLENLSFYIFAAQAEEAGYRPCRRCRPETAPGSTAWLGSSAMVQQAIKIMDSNALELLSVKDIAGKLGIGERWLCELFQNQIGASPQSILMTKKLDIARNLLDNSSLSITDIAFSSGFNSLRRFNDAFKKRFLQSPSAFKNKVNTGSFLQIELAYRPPYSWEKLLNFFSVRVLMGVEHVSDNSYQRLFTYSNDIYGWFKVKPSDNHKLKISFKLNKVTNIIAFVNRIKNMFDMDADPMAIYNDLSKDKKLKPYLQEYLGVRVAGCWDGFELAVRAIVGQKISVKGAQTLLNRLVVLCGEKQQLDETLPLNYFFPTPQAILSINLSNVGLTNSKIQAIKSLAKAIIAKDLVLDGTTDYQKTCKALFAIKGIGPWTVEYIAMRALRNPNAFPATDLEIKKQLQKFKLDPTKWLPWRAYAATLLWNISTKDKK